MMKILKKNALDGGNRVILSERGYGFRISILLTYICFAKHVCRGKYYPHEDVLEVGPKSGSSYVAKYLASGYM
jgi:hypothetical protein